MIRPIASHTTNRIQVITVRPIINPTQKTIEISGNHETKGTRKVRGRSGGLRRKKITPSDTRTNANNVPIFDRSAASPISTNPAGMPTAKQAIHVDQYGVLNFGCTAEKSLGNKPSRDIAYQMRACPY